MKRFAILLLLSMASLEAQPPTPKAMAPVDLTGYWVSVVTEDWLYRMVTPKKGDYTSVPLNAEGRKVADAWDPAKDEAAGDQCKAYGAPALMRIPGRLHITWQDDSNLKIETDAGTHKHGCSTSERPRPVPGEIGRARRSRTGRLFLARAVPFQALV